MMKFVHQDNVKETSHANKMLITYSVADIFLGLLLLALTAFMVFNYVQQNLYIERYIKQTTIVNVKK